MRDEHEYLGAYVTAHPLDQYPDADEIGITPVLNATEETTALYGMIRDITIKFRKKDNKPMAFFTLEDRSGEIQVCAFTSQYERLQSKIQEGAVVILKGNIGVDERDDEEVLKFYVEDIRKAKKASTTFYMKVPSFYRFIAEEEKALRASYEVEKGHKLIIFDELTGKFRKMKYCLSDDAVKTGLVTEKN